MIAEPIAVRVPCNPAQKGNSRRLVYASGRPRLVSSTRDKRAERRLVTALRPFAPAVPIDQPCELTLSILHPIPKSWPEWRKEAARNYVVRPASRGTQDSCNVLKLVEDAIESAGWIVDDTLLIEHRVSAYYSADPGYRIVVRPLPLLTPKALLRDHEALLTALVGADS